MKLFHALIATLFFSLNICNLSFATIEGLIKLYNPATKCTVTLIGEKHDLTNTEHNSAVEEFCQNLTKKSSKTFVLLELKTSTYEYLQKILLQ